MNITILAFSSTLNKMRSEDTIALSTSENGCFYRVFTFTRFDLPTKSE